MRGRISCLSLCLSLYSFKSSIYFYPLLYLTTTLPIPERMNGTGDGCQGPVRNGVRQVVHAGSLKPVCHIAPAAEMTKSCMGLTKRRRCCSPRTSGTGRKRRRAPKIRSVLSRGCGFPPSSAVRGRVAFHFA